MLLMIIVILNNIGGSLSAADDIDSLKDRGRCGCGPSLCFRVPLYKSRLIKKSIAKDNVQKKVCPSFCVILL